MRAKAVPGWTWLGWVLEPHIFSSVQRGAWPKHSPRACDTSQASQARSTWLEGAADTRSLVKPHLPQCNWENGLAALTAPTYI